MENPGMKCTRCRGPAQHRFPSHNLRLCHGCLEIFVRRRVEKALKKFQMLRRGQRLLVGVSGGKDSLVLWKVMTDLGFEVEALHLGLDIEGFSNGSLEACQNMAQRINGILHVRSFREMTGFTMDQVVRANKRDFCSVCGSMKRKFMNRLARELGFEAMATGHHLDDEAGRLLGNMIRHHEQYLEAQWPVLEATGQGLVRKMKPLCYLSAREIKSYAKSLDLPAVWKKCPRSKGATLPYYQQAMNLLEEKMPGTKRNFYRTFLKRKGPPKSKLTPENVCKICGDPSHAEVCAVCRLLERTREKQKAAQTP